MKNLTDERLITLFAQGKNAAFDELLRRHKSELYSYIYGVVQNRELAEDVFQDTFTKAIVTIKSGRYAESGRFIGYLYRIAHNRIVDSFRREQSLSVVSECDMEYDLFGRKDFSDELELSHEDSISYNQVLNDIRRMIKYLPEDQREIIILRFYKDMAFKDIAEKLGISINTALGRVRYAVLNLRKLSEEHHISLAI